MYAAEVPVEMNLQTSWLVTLWSLHCLLDYTAQAKTTLTVL